MRKVTLSQRKIANVGDEYRQSFIGMNAVFETWEGKRIIGTITHWSTCGMHPCLTFRDGSWARLDNAFEIDGSV